MQEQLISYKTAVLAKEKGWNGDFTESHKILTTQSLLQKFLREVHNISVEVGNEYTLKSWCCYIVEKDNEYKPIMNSDDEYFSSYEEALEEGLYQALKMI